jgi:hypothetical protein
MSAVLARPLSEAEIASYVRDGIVRVVLPDEIRVLQHEYMRQCCMFLERWGGKTASPESLPRVAADVAKKDRRLIGRLYKAARRFPAAKQLAAHDFFVRLAAALMSSPLISCCNFVAPRIDLPEEDRYLTLPHQDFPYIQGSVNGLTVWLPFHDLRADHGVPTFVLGSHEWGVLKVIEHELHAADRVGTRTIETAPDPRLPDAKYINLSPIASGEALVFHTLLVHRSEPNVTPDARFTIQLRYDDLGNAQSFARNYPEGLYLGDEVSACYPEHVVESA